MVNNRLITSVFPETVITIMLFFLERPVSPLSQSFMLDLSSKTKLPTAAWAWAINQEAGMAFCSSYTPLKQSVIIKTVQVRTKSVSFLVNGDSLNKTEDFNNFEALSKILHTFHDHKVCFGIEGDTNLADAASRCSVATISGKFIRSNQCLRLSKKKDCCAKCLEIGNYLRRKIKLRVKNPSKARVTIEKAKVQTLKRGTRRLLQRNKAIKLR